MKYVMLAALVVLAAGCTNSIFPGADVIKISNPVSVEGFDDVLQVKDIGTIPRGVVQTGQDIQLSFIIHNLDEQKSAEKVRVDMFDATIFKNSDDVFCNSPGVMCTPSSSSECTGNGCTILPREERIITYDLKAPSEEDIARISSEGEMKFRIFYDYQGTTFFRFPVIDLDEIKKRQRTDQTVDIDSPKFVGSGPIKTDVSIQGNEFALEDQITSIIVKVSDSGNRRYGALKDSSVEKGKMKIYFPEEFTIESAPKYCPAGSSTCTNNDKTDEPNSFECDGKTETDEGKGEVWSGKSGSVCTNMGKIDLIKGSSIPFLFKLKAPRLDIEPYKSYDIRVEIDYTYEIRDSAKITVLPLEE